VRRCTAVSKMGISMRFRDILPVAIVGIALTDAGARADSVVLDSGGTSPAVTKFIPSTTDWNDTYVIAGATAGDSRYALPPVAVPPAVGGTPIGATSAEATPIVVDPGRPTPPPVHALPLPSTVWSGAVLLGVSGVLLWMRKRRRDGELAVS
jgi:hypothetical protein